MVFLSLLLGKEFLSLLLFFISIISNANSRIIQSQIYSENVFGNTTELSFYYIDLNVGSPPQKQSLKLDIGIPYLGFSCKQTCSKCGNHNYPAFDFEKSSTSKYLNCDNNTDLECNNFQNKNNYLWEFSEENFIQGIFITDFVKFGDLKSINLTMGCHNIESGLFFQQKANGIIGLGLNKESQGNIIYKLYSLNLIERPLFTFCLGINGGYFIIGGINETLNLVDSTILNNSLEVNKKFYIMVKSLKFETQNEIEFPTSFALETGVSLTYLNYNFYPLFLSKFKEECELRKIKLYKGGKCIYIKEEPTVEEQLQLLPLLLINFFNGTYFWNPKDYMIQQMDDKTAFCMGIESGNENIFGTNFFHNLQFSFDLANSLAIFSEANCGNPNYNLTDKDFQNSENKPGQNNEDENNNYKENRTLFLSVFITIIIISVLILISYLIVKCSSSKNKLPQVSSNMNYPSTAINFTPQLRLDLEKKDDELKIYSIDSKS